MTGHDERSRSQERYSHEPWGEAKPEGRRRNPWAREIAAARRKRVQPSCPEPKVPLLGRIAPIRERRTAPQDAHVAPHHRGNIEVRPSFQKGIFSTLQTRSRNTLKREKFLTKNPRKALTFHGLWGTLIKDYCKLSSLRTTPLRTTPLRTTPLRTTPLRRIAASEGSVSPF